MVGITSLWLFFLLSAPFAVIVVMAPFKVGAFASGHGAAEATGLGLVGGVLVAMWNYMGWDNASTIAQEVERPQRTYPRAMIAAVVLVALTYVLPFVAVYLMGIPSSAFGADGCVGDGCRADWREDIGIRMAAIPDRAWRDDERVRDVQRAGDELLAAAAGDGAGRNAAEGVLRRRARRRSRRGWRFVVCAACWALCLGLQFERLVTLDIMLYGASLMLEFVTLVVLRIREPELKRAFKVPGGLAGAITCGIFPLLLMSLAMVQSGSETILGMNGLVFGGIIIAGGVVLYWSTKPLRRSVIAPAATPNAAYGD